MSPSKPFTGAVLGRVIAAVIVGFMLIAFTILRSSPVKGSVSPSNAGLRAWLFSAGDTLNGPIVNGNFEITNVKAGNYTLFIEGQPPYRNAIKGEIRVVDGQPTDVGVITMER